MLGLCLYAGRLECRAIGYTVKAIMGIVEGDHNATITQTASSSDPDYDGIAISNVTVLTRQIAVSVVVLKAIAPAVARMAKPAVAVAVAAPSCRPSQAYADRPGPRRRGRLVNT